MNKSVTEIHRYLKLKYIYRELVMNNDYSVKSVPKF